jgi:S-adenosylmethionine hydrolase
MLRRLLVHGDRVRLNDRIDIAGRSINGLSTNYESDAELIALIGSAGFLEVATPNGNAAEGLGVRAGDPVAVHRAEPER